MNYHPSIRGCKISFDYVNPRNSASESLWPLSPIGRSKHRGRGLEFKKHSAKLVLENVMDWSGLTSLEDLVRDTRSIETGIKDAYGIGHLSDDDLKLLIADTCFFVIVVCSILGAESRFSDENDHFGRGCVQRDIKKWLTSIFFVGNQIPFILFDKLVNSLDYLNTLRDEVRGNNAPTEWLRRALYEFIVYDSSQGSTSPPPPPPVDVLHCLRSIILGLEPQQLNIWIAGGGNDSQESASALLENGYIFRPLPRESGWRGIKCVSDLQNVIVYLPYMEIVSEESLELMIVSADQYETVHNEFMPELKCFFSLLCHLIRSPDDVRVLHEHGIIGGVNLKCLIRILAGFYTLPPDIPSHIQMREIQSYRPRFYYFWKYRYYIIAMPFLFRLLWGILKDSLQTGYTVGSYYKHG